MEAPEIRYTTTANGVRIAYGLYPGVGYPIFHIPSPGGPPIQIAHEVRGLAECFDAINKGRPAIRFDFRGTGLSERSISGITFEHQVADVEAVCDALGRELDVVAWAIGAHVALTLAARRPTLWRTMTLLGPQAVGYSTLVAELKSVRHRLSSLEVTELLMRETYEIPASELPYLAKQCLELVPETVDQAHRSAAQHADVSGLLARVSTPTLVVAWPRMQQLSAAVAAQIAGSRFVPLDSLLVNRHLGETVRLQMDRFFAELGIEYPRDGRDGNSVLSARECEVVALLAAGRSNPEIAERLSISTRTVERHARNIYAKLNVHNRVEAANWAREHGVI
jgi:DNA-binding NarL/FixJ family response regulator